MNDRDIWTCAAMEKYGGSFVQMLGRLAMKADPVNLAKIKTSWPLYWSEYEAWGFQMEANKDK